MDKAGRVGDRVGDEASFHVTCFNLGIVGVCVFWPPVKDELLKSMRYQSLLLTSMTSPPYPRAQ